MADTTPYSLRLSYVPKEEVGEDPPDPETPDPPDPNDPTPGEIDGDWLRLEQEKFPEAPAGGFSQWLDDNGKELTPANHDEYYEIYGSKCSENGDLQVKIKVHKSRPALAYKLIASYGTLSPASSSESEEKKSIDVKAATYVELQAAVSGSVSKAWEGPVYNEKGEQYDKPPEITQLRSLLSWEGKATGTIRVGYTQGYDIYTLTITPRAEEDYDTKNRETAYQSTVTAFWGNANVEQLTVSLPDMVGNCSGDTSTSYNPPGPGEDDGDCYDLYIKYHKCTGEEISRELKSVPCPEVVQADCEKRCNELEQSKVDDCLKNCK